MNDLLAVLNGMGAELVIGVIASLIGGCLLWFFRRQVYAGLSKLDMSAGAALAWLMSFLILAVLVIFPLIDVEPPSGLLALLAFLVASLLGSTVWRRK